MRDQNDQLQDGDLPDDPLEGMVVTSEPPKPPWERYGVQRLNESLAIAWNQAQNPTPISPISCCNHDLDMYLRGFRRGMVTVLGAVTNWGKTSYTLLVVNEALLAGYRPLVVTFEDHPDLYASRLLAMRAVVNAQALAHGRITDWSALSEVVETAHPTPWIYSAIGKPIEFVCKVVRELVKDECYDVVVFDYLQACTCQKKCQDRRNEVTHIARMASNTVKEAGTSGILVSQLKRMETMSKRPTLYDLKESGDIENAAEHVLLGWSSADAAGREVRLMQVAKNKDGPKSDPIELLWDYSTACFRKQV